MGTAIAILTLLNTAAPGIANLVMIIRGKDGKLTVLQFLDEADPQLDANIKQINDWMASHPRTIP